MLNFQIGKKYRRRNKEIAKCTEINEFLNLVYFDEGACVFMNNGACYRDYMNRNTPEDIIEEVKENEMKIEVGKWYKTRGGAKVFVGMYVPKGKSKPYVGYQVIENDVYFCDMSWFEDGTFASSTPMHQADIIEEWKEPKSGVAYVNVYHGNSFGALAYDTNIKASENRGNGCIACVRVEWKEGQFDD